MALPSGTTWTTTTNERVTTPVNSDQRALVASFNALLDGFQRVLVAETGDVVVTPATISNGTTVTLTVGASNIKINGVPTALAAAANTAFGSLGSIPADTWGVIAVERVAAGTVSFTSGAANYTTGYATEAAAIAALPAQSADTVQVAYLTILTASGQPWVAGTDALEGQTGGNPATTTNFYSVPSFVDTTFFTSVTKIANEAGTVITTTAG